MMERTWTLHRIYSKHETKVDVKMLTNTNAVFPLRVETFRSPNQQKSIKLVINFNPKGEREKQMRDENIGSEERKWKNISRRSNDVRVDFV